MEVRLNRPTPTAVVADGFLADPDAVRAFALTQEFAPDERRFRGQRTKTRHLWPGMREAVERLLGRRVRRDWDQHATNGVFQVCVGGDQVVYHSDQNTHAAILYLTPDAPPEAGTTLYRSRALKARTVGEALAGGRRVGGDAAQFVAAQFYDGKLLDPTAWEVVDVFGNRYNRLVIWDARLVHSASCYFGHSKETGRLFQMFFFDAE